MKRSGAVVQLVRIPACHAGGRGFESRPLRQQVVKEKSSLSWIFFVWRFTSCVPLSPFASYSLPIQFFRSFLFLPSSLYLFDRVPCASSYLCALTTLHCQRA